MFHPWKMVVLALLVAAMLLADSNGENVYPYGDIRNCPVTQPTLDERASRLLRFEVLPGIGFDNLRNLDMSQIVVYNYSRCKITNDGEYLIPDDVLVVPTRKSDVQTYAQLIEHWSEYKSLTSFSVPDEL